MLYQSTCVGFGYGLMRGLFPGTHRPPHQSNKMERLEGFVTTRWPTIVHVRWVDTQRYAVAFSHEMDVT